MSELAITGAEPIAAKRAPVAALHAQPSLCVRSTKSEAGLGG
ncbi:MAG: hypothetical protein QOI95_2889 [Acidimicrobiaceae bacterium]|jgi:hypothetical protein